MIDPSVGLLAQIPTPLREELVKRYAEICRNYIERRWEPSQLNAGKLCEVAYCVVKGYLDGSFPDAVSKPSNFPVACQQLSQIPAVPGRVGDRSFRILIPKVLVPLYEVRNHRGVGHVGGEVDANSMDASYVHASARWVICEFVRVFHDVSTGAAQRAVDAIVERRGAARLGSRGGKTCFRRESRLHSPNASTPLRCS